MTHFFKKHWVVLAAFALSFLLTIFISTEDAVIAETKVSEGNSNSVTQLSDQFRVANNFLDMPAPTLDFGL